MSLRASLANAAVVALRFQESCAVFFHGSGNFLDKIVILWPGVCDEMQEKGRTARGFDKEKRSPERK